MLVGFGHLHLPGQGGALSITKNLDLSSKFCKSLEVREGWLRLMLMANTILNFIFVFETLPLVPFLRKEERAMRRSWFEFSLFKENKKIYPRI